MSLRRAARPLALAAALAACQGPAPQPQGAPPPEAPAMPATTPPPPPPSVQPPQAATERLLLKDSGVRCITFPCPSYSVQAQGEREPRPVHELDLAALPSDAEREHVHAALQAGVQVQGTLSVRAKAGPAGDATVLHVTRVLK